MKKTIFNRSFYLSLSVLVGAYSPCSKNLGFEKIRVFRFIRAIMPFIALAVFFFFYFLLTSLTHSFTDYTREQVRYLFPNDYVYFNKLRYDDPVAWFKVNNFSEPEISNIKWNEEILTRTPRSVSVKFKYTADGKPLELKKKIGLRVIPNRKITDDPELPKLIPVSILNKMAVGELVVCISLPLWQALFPNTPFIPDKANKIKLAIENENPESVRIGYVFPYNPGQYWSLMGLNLLEKISGDTDLFDNHYILNINNLSSKMLLKAKYDAIAKSGGHPDYQLREWQNRVPFKLRDLMDKMGSIAKVIPVAMFILIFFYLILFYMLFNYEVRSNLNLLRIYGFSRLHTFLLLLLVNLLLFTLASGIGLLGAYAIINVLIASNGQQYLYDLGISISPFAHIPWIEVSFSFMLLMFVLTLIAYINAWLIYKKDPSELLL